MNVTREQLQFESMMLEEQRQELIRNSQPIFNLMQGGSMGGSAGTRIYMFALFNHGKSCTDVKINVPEKTSVGRPVLASGDKFDFNLELPHDHVEPFTVIVTYLDERLIQGSTSYTASKPGHDFVITANE